MRLAIPKQCALLHLDAAGVVICLGISLAFYVATVAPLMKHRSVTTMQRVELQKQREKAAALRASVVKAAENLHGHLLIVHGTMDDNVHFQNSIQLLHALQQAGKLNFDYMPYPKARHGVGSPHRGKLNEQFMKEHL